ncbi:MAG TPA: transposase [Planctomycetota bacterium]|nr:transposase [Planctomycetota bacterium]
MSGPTPRRLKRFFCQRYRLQTYLRSPGDGRPRPQIPAEDLLWSQLIGQVLREGSFHGVEALVRSPARRALAVSRAFGDDALAYFTERLDPAPSRRALSSVLQRAKRNKAFDKSRFIGLALDGTTAARCRETRCRLCHPVLGPDERLLGYRHHFSLVSVVGTGLSLPFDLEPYEAGEGESTASQRLLERAVRGLGPRFADYLVADGLYATAPMLHRAGDLGLKVVVRLKGNLPELFAAAQARFAETPPTMVFQEGNDRIEIWDAEDFDPWEALRWTTVRVLRYRQWKPDGTIVEAYWLTDFPSTQVGSRALYHMAKSRWEIENQGFNEAKTHHGIEHMTHHHANSLLIAWLLALFTLTLERLYRLRYLHRGTHPPRTAIELVRALRLTLCPLRAPDTS